jgi:hypothetical protein
VYIKNGTNVRITLLETGYTAQVLMALATVSRLIQKVAILPNIVRLVNKMDVLNVKKYKTIPTNPNGIGGILAKVLL